MSQELKAEDLIVTDQDGTCRINHEMLESYGLFNLPSSLMRRALMVYYENAKRQGHSAALTVQTFVRLAQAIRKFPKPVEANFTRGAAYRQNLHMLKRFSK